MYWRKQQVELQAFHLSHNIVELERVFTMSSYDL